MKAEEIERLIRFFVKNSPKIALLILMSFLFTIYALIDMLMR
jgi:hypothetical protein